MASKIAWLGVLLTIAATATVAADKSDIVLGCNYDLELTIDGAAYHVTHRDRVRSGSAIAFDFGRRRADLKISSISAESYKVEFSIYEQSQDRWYQVNATDPSFEADFGVPTEFEWAGDGIELQVALMVSVMPVR